jgi:hypothetical protein
MEAVALIVALALGATAVTRRAPEPSGELSLARPLPLPRAVPWGQDARDIRTYDAWVDHPGHAVTPRAILAAWREAERVAGLHDEV